MNNFEDILFVFSSNASTRKYVRLNLHEAGLLFRTALKSPGDIIEIGTKIGGSAVLLSAASRGRKVYSVDIIPHGERKEGRELDKIAPKELLNNIEFVIEESTKLAKRWDKKMGLIFIDGSHMPEDVKKDIDAWKPHVMDGGYMVFHDIGVAGNKEGMRLARRLQSIVKARMVGWRYIEQAQSLLVMQNVSDSSQEGQEK